MRENERKLLRPQNAIHGDIASDLQNRGNRIKEKTHIIIFVVASTVMYVLHVNAI